MPWDIDTYAGVEIYDPSDGARIGMRQLMIAINQREAAIGETETEWLLPDGITEMTQPWLTDLIGAEVKASSTIKINCERIRAAILALLAATHGPSGHSQVFVESSESDTYWTILTLQTAIGHTYVASTGPQDALFLQNSKDILDRLIYVRYAVSPTNRSATLYYNTAPAVETTFDGAWGAMVSAPLGDPGGFLGWSAQYASPAIGPGANEQHLGAYVGTETYPGDKISTCRIDGGVCDFDLSDYSGVITAADFGYILVCPTIPFSVNFGGLVLSASATIDVESILVFGSTNTTTFSWVSVPISIGPVGEVINMFRMGGIVIYGEIAGILADQ